MFCNATQRNAVFCTFLNVFLTYCWFCCRSLASNGLTGPLPIALTSSMSLETLRVESNTLSGVIPPILSASLTVLQLFENCFDMPSEGLVSQCAAVAARGSAANCTLVPQGHDGMCVSPAPTNVTVLSCTNVLGVSWDLVAASLISNISIAYYSRGKSPLGMDLLPNATSVILNNLTNGATYDVFVRAVSYWGAMPPVHISGIPTPPYRVLDIVAVAGVYSATVSWSTVERAGCLELSMCRVRTYPRGMASFVRTATSQLIVEVANLSAYFQYWFTVACADATGLFGPESFPSSIVVPLGSGEVTVPTSPRYAELVGQDWHSLCLFWGTPNGDGGAPVINFSLQLTGVDDSGPTTRRNYSTTNISHYCFTELNTTTNYTAFIRTCNVVGCSVDATESNTLRTYAAVPSAPLNVTWTPLTRDGQLTTVGVVAWDLAANSGAEVVNFTVFSEPTSCFDSVTVSAPLQHAIIHISKPGLVFYVFVTATASNGEYSMSSRPRHPVCVSGAIPQAPGWAAAEKLPFIPWSVNISWQQPHDRLRVHNPLWFEVKGQQRSEHWRTNTSGASWLVVYGITEQTSFHVWSLSCVGRSEVPAVTNSVVPGPAIPGPPVLSSFRRLNVTAIELRWFMGSDGGSPILEFVVTASPPVAAAVSYIGLTGAIVPGLVSSTPYSFAIVGVNAVGVGVPLITPTVVPSQDVPLPVSKLRAVALCNATQVLWNAPKTCNNSAMPFAYIVEARPQQTAPSSFECAGRNQTVPAGPNALSVTILPLCNGVVYDIVVISTGVQGNSPPAAVSVIPCFENPQEPDQPAVEAGNQSATVTWTPGNYNGGALLWMYAVSVFEVLGERTEFVTVQNVSAAGLPITVLSRLTNGQTYFFCVVAVNFVLLASPSVCSSPVLVEPFAPCSPIDLRCSPIPNADREISIEWTYARNPRCLLMRPFCYVVNILGTNASCEVDATETACTFGELPVGVMLSFSVSAVNGNGAATSFLFDGCTAAAGEPDPPALLHGIESLNQTLFVRWHAPAQFGGVGLAGYEVTANSESDVGWMEAASIFVDNSTLSTRISNLANGVEYTVSVTAYNDAGNCATVQAQQMPTAEPMQVNELFATASADGRVILDWDEPFDNGVPIEFYTVFCAGTGERCLSLNTTTATQGSRPTTQWAFTGLDVDVVYWFRVAAWNGRGRGEYSRSTSAQLAALHITRVTLTEGGIAAASTLVLYGILLCFNSVCGRTKDGWKRDWTPVAAVVGAVYHFVTDGLFAFALIVGGVQAYVIGAFLLTVAAALTWNVRYVLLARSALKSAGAELTDSDRRAPDIRQGGRVRINVCFLCRCHVWTSVGGTASSLGNEDARWTGGLDGHEWVKKHEVIAVSVWLLGILNLACLRLLNSRIVGALNAPVPVLSETVSSHAGWRAKVGKGVVQVAIVLSVGLSEGSAGLSSLPFALKLAGSVASILFAALVLCERCSADLRRRSKAADASRGELSGHVLLEDNVGEGDVVRTCSLNGESCAIVHTQHSHMEFQPDSSGGVRGGSFAERVSEGRVARASASQAEPNDGTPAMAVVMGAVNDRRAAGEGIADVAMGPLRRPSVAHGIGEGDV